MLENCLVMCLFVVIYDFIGYDFENFVELLFDGLKN